MPVEAYTGLMGDGKTYEVVKSVVVPAIARGQRVVTNIRGLNADAIGKHLSIPPGRVTQLIKEFHIDEAYAANFYPSEGKEDGVLEWGAFNIIDEAHFIFGTGTKFDDRAKYFLRQHRHEECDGRSTQIVCITQSVDDLTSYVKNVVQVTTRCIKQRALGRSKKYWCRKFQGPTEVPSKQLAQHVYSYCAPYIHMYSTQRGSTVSESGVDNRISIWTSPAFRVAVGALSLGVVALVYFGFTFQSHALAALHIKPAPGRGAVESSENKPCHNPIVMAVTGPKGDRTFFVNVKGSLRPVPSGSVLGFAFQQFSSYCPA